jgi:hypothetical protein
MIHSCKGRAAIRSCNDGASVDAGGEDSRVSVAGDWDSVVPIGLRAKTRLFSTDRGSAFTEAGSHRLHNESSAGEAY